MYDLSYYIRELTWIDVSTEKATEACNKLGEEYPYYSEFCNSIKELKFRSSLTPDQALEICLEIEPEFELISQINDGISKLKSRGLTTEIAASTLMQLKTNFKAVDMLSDAIRDLQWNTHLSPDLAAQLCSKVALCLQILPDLGKSISTLLGYSIDPEKAVKIYKDLLPDVQLCQYFSDSFMSLIGQGVEAEKAFEITKKFSPKFYKLDEIYNCAWAWFYQLEPAQSSDLGTADVISHYIDEILGDSKSNDEDTENVLVEN